MGAKIKMGRLFDTLKEKFKKAISNSPDNMVQSYEGRDDWETRDKYVRSLRRQYRRIQDEQEKKYLQQKISSHYEEKNKGIITDRDNILKHNTFKTKKEKQKGFFTRGRL